MTRSDHLARHVAPELSEARLARQYASIAERLQQPRSRPLVWLWVAPGAVVIALVFFLVRGSGSSEATAPREIATLETGTEGQALTLADGSRIEAARETKLVLSTVSLEAVRLELDHGKVECDVTKNPVRRFVVAAGAYEVRVVGTRFGVALSKQEIRVDVSRGAVEITHQGELPRRISAGETWSASLGEVHATRAEPKKTEAAGPTAPAASSAEPALVAAKSVESAKQLFDRAQKARAAGRASEAREALLALRARYPNDARASLAAFELARLELDMKGDAKQASKLLDDAVKNAPAGSPLKEDAEARRVEALEKTGDKAACRAARSAFLARYPKSVHRSRVLRACPDS